MIENYEDLPEDVKEAIFNEALSACPDCGLRGVPQSWAVATYNALESQLFSI